MDEIKDGLLNEGLGVEQPSNQNDVQPDNVEQQGQVQQEESVKTPYTPEELAEIIEKDLPIDTSRLSLEGIALMKSFQRGFTPKLQEASEAKKQLEQLRSELEKIKEANKTPEEKLKDEFLKNPDKVLSDINEVISDLLIEASSAKIEGDDAKVADIKRKIAQLETLKSKLIIEKPKNDMAVMNERERQALLALNSAIEKAPIIKDKGDDIYNYAISNLGYTPETLQRLLDPVTNGVDVVVKNLVLLAKAYEAYELQNKANQIKQTPNKVMQQTTQNMMYGGGNAEIMNEYQRLLSEASKGNVSLADVLEFKQKHNIR